MGLIFKHSINPKRSATAQNSILHTGIDYVSLLVSILFIGIFSAFMYVIFADNNFFVVLLSCFCFLILVVAAYISANVNINISNRVFEIILLLSLLFYFLINFCFAYFARINLLADVAIIYESIADILDDGVLNDVSPTLAIAYPDLLLESNADYFCRYYNNIFILLLFSGIYHMFAFLGFEPGTPEGQTLLLFFTSLITVTAIYFIVKTIEEMFKNKLYSFLTLALCFLFLPFLYSTPNFYTDIWVMPFLFAGIYYFTKNKNKFSISNVVVLSIAFSVSLMIKATAIVIIIAVLIMLTLDFLLDIRNKRRILCIAMMILILILSNVLFESFYRNSGIFDFSSEHRLSLPKQIWLLFGSHDEGGYSYSDNLLAVEGETLEERNKAVNDEIRRVYSSYGFVEFFQHLAYKLAFTWNDPHFDTSEYTKWPIYNNWTLFFTQTNQIGYFLSYWFSKVYTLVLFICTLINAFIFTRKKLNYFSLFCNINLLGMIIYTSFFESAPRKVFIIIPFLMFNFVFLIDFVRTIKKKKKTLGGV